MSKPYIYIVKNKQNGKFYIGSQCSCKIVGINYFTSSTNKEFKEDFKNNDNVIILSCEDILNGKYKI